ncbi:16S rRNA (guanine(966)-N(2))-methyltransferase RsmD [Pseudooceanicola sp. LIPI14-2-Ac024]|uniref:16S rRNA (guanine(966)-N(2))-methyltransferase RsmD n=1 Tax=Pseudooceanicola sp. LIPI14-2-Ac024 TaxID=3344875 RepID=UPI0035D01B8A
MRIIAGEWRGRPLAALGKGDAGAHLRPTTDRVRESLFSALAGGRYGDPLTEARVLDLFAGTGALGLEALSRGAEFATFVDDGRVATQLIKQNVAALGAAPRARLMHRDARRLPVNDDPPATLVFLDPPYGRNLGAPVLANALQGGWIAPEALVVWEEREAQAAPPGFTLIDSRAYGDTHVTFLQAD